MTFEVAPVESQTAEQDSAKAYWAQQKFGYYQKMQPWSLSMADAVLGFAPSSVLEFGCNVGKNLLAIREKQPGVFLAGIDVNAEAVKFGREAGALRLTTGDEFVLSVIPDDAYDVSFTVSVLDHIATPEAVLADLARVSRKAVLLLEPWLGEEGKVVRNTNKSGDMIDTTPFSYSWDYRTMASAVLPGWRLDVEPLRLESNLGPYYELYTLTPAA